MKLPKILEPLKSDNDMKDMKEGSYELIAKFYVGRVGGPKILMKTKKRIVNYYGKEEWGNW